MKKTIMMNYLAAGTLALGLGISTVSMADNHDYIIQQYGDFINRIPLQPADDPVRSCWYRKEMYYIWRNDTSNAAMTHMKNSLCHCKTTYGIKKDSCYS